MKKPGMIFFVLVIIFLAALAIYFFMDKDEEIVEENNDEMTQEEESNDVLGNDEPEFTEVPSDEFIQCLVDSGMVVYASKTCPACSALANSFGGYDAVENLFVFCNDDSEACTENMQTTYVPEIQHNGVVFEGARTMDAFASLTDCEL
jgi:hypothetical protein